ncbi:DUF4350 domain-containing protein [Bacillus sp. 2205SS5-2]|uniref:DUF4350 domain-containing protein n=1 Tax=Bacillus sp. 2205SS5-2 TaxID=3109031 RepID=UPI0030040619
MKFSSNWKVWAGLAVLISAFLMLSSLVTSQKPKEYPPFDSQSPSPTGMKAIYQFLGDEQLSVKRWIYSPEKLPSGKDNQLLVMVEPFTMPNSRETNEYEAFMEAGNTILLVKENPKGMFDLKTTMKEDIFADNEMQEIDLVGRSSSFRLEENGEEDVLIEDKSGVLAFKQIKGDGQLIVATFPTIFMNQNIPKRENIGLILTLLNEGNAAEGTILFDEYSHSGESAATFLTLYPRWFLLLLLQGTLGVFLWLWYRGKRFGFILIPREETVRFSDEKLQALAAWYMKGRQYQASLTIQGDYVRMLLQERWGVPVHKEWLDIEDSLSKLSWSKKERHSFLAGITDTLTKEKITKQEFLQWSLKIDRMRKEVEDRELRNHILNRKI